MRIALLNMTIQRHCFHVGLVTADGDMRKRFFFRALEPQVDRTCAWRASARPRTVNRTAIRRDSRSVAASHSLQARLDDLQFQRKTLREEVTFDDRWPKAYQRIGALEDKTDRIFALAGMNYIQNQYPQREWKQADARKELDEFKAQAVRYCERSPLTPPLE
jgi:hypothetical protein